MIRLVVFMALMLFSMPAMAQEATQDAEHKPQIYDFNGAPVDPLCFLNNVGAEDKAVYPTIGCEWAELSATGESPLDPKFVSASYEENFYDPETGENFKSHGFVGYRAIGQVKDGDQNSLAVHVVENGGGSGVFHTLMLLDIDKDKDGNMILRQHSVITGGDRCNGGIRAADVKDGQLYYQQNVTMFDMLGLVGDPERDILQSERANGVYSCAICCYGIAEFTMDGLQRISFDDKRFKPHDKDNDKDHEASHCIEAMVNLNVSNGIHTFTKDEFSALLREIEHVCLGRMEGE